MEAKNIERYVLTDCSLYDKIEKIARNDDYVEFIIRNKWQLLDILQAYSKEIEAIKADG